MELQSLKKILQKLMSGDIEKIATQTHRSKNAVYQVFRKESFVPCVIETTLDTIENNALEMLKFVKEKRAELNESVKQRELKRQNRNQKQAA